MTDTKTLIEAIKVHIRRDSLANVNWLLVEQVLAKSLAQVRREERIGMYQEIADEFHPNIEMGNTARGLCAQFEAVFLRRAEEYRQQVKGS